MLRDHDGTSSLPSRVIVSLAALQLGWPGIHTMARSSPSTVWTTTREDPNPCLSHRLFHRLQTWLHISHTAGLIPSSLSHCRPAATHKLIAAAREAFLIRLLHHPMLPSPLHHIHHSITISRYWHTTTSPNTSAPPKDSSPALRFCRAYTDSPTGLGPEVRGSLTGVAVQAGLPIEASGRRHERPRIQERHCRPQRQPASIAPPNDVN